VLEVAAVAGIRQRCCDIAREVVTVEYARSRSATSVRWPKWVTNIHVHAAMDAGLQEMGRLDAILVAAGHLERRLRFWLSWLRAGAWRTSRQLRASGVALIERGMIFSNDVLDHCRFVPLIGAQDGRTFRFDDRPARTTIIIPSYNEN